MAIRDSKVIIPMFLAIFFLIYVADSVQGLGRLPTNEEDMELDRQLKLINKAPLKSFQTGYGDIVDCIDIYKQLAFDHPMLKNHTIQMEPKTIPKEVGNEASTVYKYLQYMPKNIKCPPGSVPIKRASREDLMMAKSIKSLALSYPTNSPYHGKNVDTRGHHSAVLEHTSGNFGARARLSVWNPSVKENQFSSGGMWIANGDVDELTSIQTGWIVHKDSGESRLYTYWTADGYQNTGCFNTLCEGFVHVNPKIALGLVLPHSIVNGSQFDVLLSLYLDRVSGHWWLMLEDKYIGYWPRTVIPVLGGGARFVSWGGQIYSPLNVLSPAMGSGNYPADAIGVNYGKTAYVRQIKVVPDYKDSTKFEDPKLTDVKTWADKPVCYKAQKFVNEVRGWGFQLYFGGPRGCNLHS